MQISSFHLNSADSQKKVKFFVKCLSIVKAQFFLRFKYMMDVSVFTFSCMCSKSPTNPFPPPLTKGRDPMQVFFFFLSTVYICTSQVCLFCVCVCVSYFTVMFAVAFRDNSLREASVLFTSSAQL